MVPRSIVTVSILPSSHSPPWSLRVLYCLLVSVFFTSFDPGLSSRCPHYLRGGVTVHASDSPPTPADLSSLTCRNYDSSANEEDCFRLDQADYTGLVGTTASGKSCLDGNYQEGGFCRNTEGSGRSRAYCTVKLAEHNDLVVATVGQEDCAVACGQHSSSARFYRFTIHDNNGGDLLQVPEITLLTGGSSSFCPVSVTAQHCGPEASYSQEGYIADGDATTVYTTTAFPPSSTSPASTPPSSSSSSSSSSASVSPACQVTLEYSAAVIFEHYIWTMPDRDDDSSAGDALGEAGIDSNTSFHFINFPAAWTLHRRRTDGGEGEGDDGENQWIKIDEVEFANFTARSERNRMFAIPADGLVDADLDVDAGGDGSAVGIVVGCMCGLAGVLGLVYGYRYYKRQDYTVGIFDSHSHSNASGNGSGDGSGSGSGSGSGTDNSNGNGNDIGSISEHGSRVRGTDARFGNGSRNSRGNGDMGIGMRVGGSVRMEVGSGRHRGRPRGEVGDRSRHYQMHMHVSAEGDGKERVEHTAGARVGSLGRRSSRQRNRNGHNGIGIGYDNGSGNGSGNGYEGVGNGYEGEVSPAVTVRVNECKQEPEHVHYSGRRKTSNRKKESSHPSSSASGADVDGAGRNNNREGVGTGNNRHIQRSNTSNHSHRDRRGNNDTSDHAYEHEHETNHTNDENGDDDDDDDDDDNDIGHGDRRRRDNSSNRVHKGGYAANTANTGIAIDSGSNTVTADAGRDSVSGSGAASYHRQTIDDIVERKSTRTFSRTHSHSRSRSINHISNSNSNNSNSNNSNKNNINSNSNGNMHPSLSRTHSHSHSHSHSRTKSRSHNHNHTHAVSDAENTVGDQCPPRAPGRFSARLRPLSDTRNTSSTSNGSPNELSQQRNERMYGEPGDGRYPRSARNTDSDGNGGGNGHYNNHDDGECRGRRGSLGQNNDTLANLITQHRISRNNTTSGNNSSHNSNNSSNNSNGSKGGIVRVQSREASERIAELERKTTCCICLDGEKEILLMPCSHLACCKSCSVNLTKCPLCRATILHKTQVFL